MKILIPAVLAGSAYCAMDAMKPEMDSMKPGMEPIELGPPGILPGTELPDKEAADWENELVPEAPVPLLEEIANYGCWCKFGSHALFGSGKPKDAIDELCKRYTLCLRCPHKALWGMPGAVQSSERCDVHKFGTPNMMFYNQDNERDLLKSCFKQNRGDICKANSCFCHAQFMGDLTRVILAKRKPKDPKIKVNKNFIKWADDERNCKDGDVHEIDGHWKCYERPEEQCPEKDEDVHPIRIPYRCWIPSKDDSIKFGKVTEDSGVLADILPSNGDIPCKFGKTFEVIFDAKSGMVSHGDRCFSVLDIETDGTSAKDVVFAACDPGADNQKFDMDKEGRLNVRIRPSYCITYFQSDRSGIIKANAFKGEAKRKCTSFRNPMIQTKPLLVDVVERCMERCEDIKDKDMEDKHKQKEMYYVCIHRCKGAAADAIVQSCEDKCIRLDDNGKKYHDKCCLKNCDNDEIITIPDGAVIKPKPKCVFEKFTYKACECMCYEVTGYEPTPMDNQISDMMNMDSDEKSVPAPNDCQRKCHAVTGIQYRPHMMDCVKKCRGENWCIGKCLCKLYEEENTPDLPDIVVEHTTCLGFCDSMGFPKKRCELICKTLESQEYHEYSKECRYDCISRLGKDMMNSNEAQQCIYKCMFKLADYEGLLDDDYAVDDPRNMCMAYAESIKVKPALARVTCDKLFTSANVKYMKMCMMRDCEDVEGFGCIWECMMAAIEEAEQEAQDLQDSLKPEIDADMDVTKPAEEDKPMDSDMDVTKPAEDDKPMESDMNETKPAEEESKPEENEEPMKPGMEETKPVKEDANKPRNGPQERK